MKRSFIFIATLTTGLLLNGCSTNNNHFVANQAPPAQEQTSSTMDISTREFGTEWLNNSIVASNKIKDKTLIGTGYIDFIGTTKITFESPMRVPFIDVQNEGMKVTYRLLFTNREKKSDIWQKPTTLKARDRVRFLGTHAPNLVVNPNARYIYIRADEIEQIAIQ